MYIADNIIKNRLKNVYFIWGRGKTTIATKLQEKYGFFVYSTDASRYPHVLEAEADNQPYMCRDFEKEHDVKSFWELPQEVINEREEHFLQEMTPMIIADLLVLSSKHNVIICEGDVDYKAVIPVASNMVHLCNQGTKFDWFARPDHEDLVVSLSRRSDLSEEEKQVIIENAYACCAGKEGIVPEWVNEFEVKSINWDDSTSIEQTVYEVEQYFQFQMNM